MLPSLNQILIWLEHYRYFLLFPVSVIEGPIVTVLAGFLASLGQFNFIIAYVIVVIGDIVGDAILYYLGKYSVKSGIPSWLRFFGITPERVLFVEKRYAMYPKKIFFMGKLSHGVGAAVLFAAGAVKFPFKKFIIYNFLLTLVKSLIVILIGYYFGQAYGHIKTYLDYFAIFFAVVFIGLYVVFLKYSNSYLKDENNHSN